MAGMLALSACTTGPVGTSPDGGAGGEEVQARPGLFLAEDDQSASQRAQEQPHIKRARAARLNPELLAPGDGWLDELEEVELQLFEDVVVVVRRERVEQAPSGNLSWVGYSSDRQTQAILTASGGVLAGIVATRSGSYRVRPAADGLVTIVETAAAGLDCVSAPRLPAPPQEARGRLAGDEIQPLTTEGFVLDVLQLYTQQAATAYGFTGTLAQQQAAMEAHCDADVAWMNQAYLNSDVEVSMRNVGVELINYTESGSGTTELFRLTAVGESTGNEGSVPVFAPNLDWATGGPYLESAHTRRNALGADLVMLRCSALGAGEGGLAYVTTSASSFFNSYGFAVMANPTATEVTMAHEFAHNQGCHHDKATGGYPPDGQGPKYAMAYSLPNVLCTITGYPIPAGSFGLYVQYFSNPNLSVVPPGGGAPVVLTDMSEEPDDRPDEHRRINELRDTLVNFRTHIQAYAPPAPTNLTGTALGPASIRVTWTDNSEGEDRFQVQRRLNGTSTWTTRSTTPNATSYTDTGLTEGRAYFYRVRAVVGNELSPWSSTVTVRAKPKGPTNLTLTALDQRSIQLDWTDNSAAENRFQIWRRTGTGGAYVNIATPLGANLETYTDSGLAPSTRYFYYVRAAFNNVSSPSSNVTSVVTAPAVPGNPSAVRTGPGTLRFTWSDNSPDETQFIVQRRLNAGAWQNFTVAANVTQLVQSGLTVGGTYTYRVQAKRGVARSSFSGQSSAVP